MTVIPIRSLGKIGVITDVNPADLPPEAVTSARNVRFSNGRITNAHVWREALNDPDGTAPSFVFSSANSDDADVLGYVSDEGRVYHLLNGQSADLTPLSYTPAESEAVRTFCFLQGVYYVCQEDRVPWYKTVLDSAVTYAYWAAETYATVSSYTYDSIAAGVSTYAPLSAWDSNHRCRVLRSFKDYLIALNVTKSGVVAPNMVKWSNIALYGAPPDSWDPSDLTRSAGENTLGDIQTGILDGAELRNSFIVYSADQAWSMDYTGGPDVFQFTKLFSGRGIVNTNCVVEQDGVHFVFDADDIYIHDGVSPPKSICAGRVRNAIFRNIDLTKSSVFFVHKDVAASEVWFCFNSKDESLLWNGADISYCNVAAVYNFKDDTWTFYDLPNISGMASHSWRISATYNNSTGVTYASSGSSYTDLTPNNTLHSFAMSVAEDSVDATRLIQADNGIGSVLPFPAVASLSVTPKCERTGLDLDELVPELKAYKNYRAIYPQVTAEDTSAPFSFKFGGVDMPSQALEWDDLQTFEPTTEYKVDTRARGRYLAWYFEGANNNTYSLSGFDLDFVATSRR